METTYTWTAIDDSHTRMACATGANQPASAASPHRPWPPRCAGPTARIWPIWPETNQGRGVCE